MARTRLSVADLLVKVRRKMRDNGSVTDDNGNLKYRFSTDTLIDCMQEGRDLLEMELSVKREGFNVKTTYTDLVAAQERYAIPSNTNRVIRVFFRRTDGTEVAIPRFETPLGESRGTGDPFCYRLKGKYVVLEPIPTTSITGGLRFDHEESPDPIASVNDQAIPDDWPPICETILVLLTARNGFLVEGAQGPLPQGLMEDLNGQVEGYWVQLSAYLEDRTGSQSFSTPLVLG